MVRRDLTGQRFDRLLVLGFPTLKGRLYTWLCRCDCGKETIVFGVNLVSCKSRSCGCISAEMLSEMRFIHGKSETPEYVSWKSMMIRCFNPEHREYHNYGGRGIIICDKWLGRNGFENFLADMGTRPTPQHSIDRYPNINGNYEPSNCRWATTKQQARGKRSNVNITYNGETHCLMDWSSILGLTYDCLRSRLGRKKDRASWTLEKAFTTPLQIR